MNKLRKYLMILIILILVLYTALALYLKILATLLIHHAIDEIKTSVPAISDVQYERIHFYPYDFFNKTVSIEGLTIRFKNSDLVLKIDEVKLNNFTSLRQNPFGSFNISMTHLQMTSLPDLASILSGWNTNLPVSVQGISLPSGMSLILSANINYNALTHCLQLDLDTHSSPDFIVLTDQIILDQVVLNSNFFSNAGFMATMNNAVISQMNYHTNISLNLPTAILQNNFPLPGNFLQNLGYTTLPISLQASTEYDGDNHVQTGNAQLSILNLGQFNANWQVLVTTPPATSDLSQLLMDPDAEEMTQAENSPNLIQFAQINFNDQSFMNRFFQFLASNTNQSVATVQSSIQSSLNNFAQNLSIPQLSAIANTLNNFIANPSSLTIQLNPITPFSINDISTFFNAQQSLKMNIQQSLSNLPDSQKATLINNYEKTSTETYSNFFNKIGLSVSANEN